MKEDREFGKLRSFDNTKSGEKTDYFVLIMVGLSFEADIMILRHFCIDDLSLIFSFR